jgi:hypothetical protein
MLSHGAHGTPRWLQPTARLCVRRSDCIYIIYMILYGSYGWAYGHMWACV